MWAHAVKQFLLKDREYRLRPSASSLSLSSLTLPPLGTEGEISRTEMLTAGGGFIRLGKNGSKSPKEPLTPIAKTRSLERGLLSGQTGTRSCRSSAAINSANQSLRRSRMTRQCAVRVQSLPDASGLAGLTSELDRAMENMIKMGNDPKLSVPEEEDTDTSDTDSSDSELEIEEGDAESELPVETGVEAVEDSSPATRLAEDFQTSVDALMYSLLEGDSPPTVETITRAREALWLVRQEVGLTLPSLGMEIPVDTVQRGQEVWGHSHALEARRSIN